MYSFDSLIGQIYGELENLVGYNVLKIVPQAEKGLYGFIEELELDRNIENDIVYKIGDFCSEFLTLSEIKGFISGIYFALKLREEFKKDFEKIEKFIDSFDN